MTTATAKITSPRAGVSLAIKGEPVTIAPSCSSNGGHWTCVTHDEDFSNNLSAHFHENDGRRHVTVWVCHEHGPEQP